MRICLAATALVALGVLAAALVMGLRAPRPAAAGAAPASRASTAPAGTTTPSPRTSTAAAPATADYSFGTLGDPGDATFNELLSINNHGHIGGYFGSGAAGHPNTGYILRPPYARAKYQKIMYPGSAQTRLTGLNNTGVQVGFWSGRTGRIAGWYLSGGQFHSVAFPAAGGASSPVNELLGVNDHDVAVGFYTDTKGLDHGYTYDIATKRFAVVTVPGAGSVVAAAINNAGSVAGFFTDPAGRAEGFVLTPGGQLSVLGFPHATATRATGINDAGEVVGGYQLAGTGSETHGFTWTGARGFATVDGPGGAVNTTISGVNDAGDLVGYYTDRAGHTDGLLATPEG
jgi:probable HAF family extracellular repeat protein